VPENPIINRGGLRDLGKSDRRRRIHAWQERIRDPSLTLLLVLDVAAIFFAGPLAARGMPIAEVVADTLVLVVVLIVVVLSDRPGAIISMLLGLVAIAASLPFGAGWPPMVATVLRGGGSIITWSALIWVVGHALYAPGRITLHRLQGAAVIYLSFATVFASAYALIWELRPTAFANLDAAAGGPAEIAAMLYFSLSTLTTTGYGDIIAVDPFARSLANLESVIGVFYLAVTVARLVTLELEERRR
jgi:Ion channel